MATSLAGQPHSHTPRVRVRLARETTWLHGLQHLVCIHPLVLLIYVLILYMAAIISLKIACKRKRIRYKLQKLNEYVPLFEGHEDYSELENEGGDREAAAEPFNEDHFPARLFEVENAHDSLRGSVRARNYGTSHTA